MPVAATPVGAAMAATLAPVCAAATTVLRGGGG